MSEITKDLRGVLSQSNDTMSELRRQLENANNEGNMIQMKLEEMAAMAVRERYGLAKNSSGATYSDTDDNAAQKLINAQMTIVRPNVPK